MSSTTHISPISMTIISNINPLAFPIGTTGTNHNPIKARWQALWRSFAMVYISTTAPSLQISSNHSMDVDAILQEECEKTPVLQNIGTTFRKYVLSQSEGLSGHHYRESVITAILQMAWPYYEETWASLTVEEQLALFHLARDRFIHVEHPGLEPLLRKGLIEFKPDLRIMNASLQNFVLMAGERDELAQQDAQMSNSVWNTLKIPLGMGLATIIAALILTQEELRMALPAVISLLPLLLQNLPDLIKWKIKPS